MTINKLMSKAAIVIVLLFLAACGTGYEPYTDYQYPEPMIEEDTDADYVLAYEYEREYESEYEYELEYESQYKLPAYDCPLKLALINHEAIIEAEEVPINLPEFGQFVSYRIRYQVDEYEVIGYVVAPADFADANYSIVIFNRGGNQEFGIISSPSMLIHFTVGGSIVLASQLRGVAGGTSREQFGGDDINDVLKLIDISETFDFAQQGGVYMFGASRGGMMTYIATRLDDRIVAAAVWAAVSDVFSWYQQRGDMRPILSELIGGSPNDEEWIEEYEKRSAVFWADEIQAPILIMHGGTADWRVRTSHSVYMAEALERYGRPHRLVLFPDADHSMPSEAAPYLLEWFMQHPVSP